VLTDGAEKKRVGQAAALAWLPVGLVLIGALPASMPAATNAADSPPPQESPRRHADESFRELSQHERQAPGAEPDRPNHMPGLSPSPSSYPAEEYLRGVGEGDLSKGRVACQRVSELAARTDLAKQIRVRVTEHAVDRLRERMGRPVEQDIEVVREERVNELLRDVRIVDKRVDEASGTCTSIAVMPRSRVAPDAGPDSRDRPTPSPGP
jgi:hypothetical protein